jgi:hypothetical protein
MDYTLQIFGPECNLPAKSKLKESLGVQLGLAVEDEAPKPCLMFKMVEMMKKMRADPTFKLPQPRPGTQSTMMSMEGERLGTSSSTRPGFEAKPKEAAPLKPMTAEPAARKIDSPLLEEEKKGGKKEEAPIGPAAKKPAKEPLPALKPLGSKLASLPAPEAKDDIKPKALAKVDAPKEEKKELVKKEEPAKASEVPKPEAKIDTTKKEEVKKLAPLPPLKGAREPEKEEKKGAAKVEMPPKAQPKSAIEVPAKSGTGSEEKKTSMEIDEEIMEEIDIDKDAEMEEPVDKGARVFTDSAGCTISGSIGADPSVDSCALENYDYVEPVEKTSQP